MAVNNRKKIGILFVFGKVWMGGVYYLASLIRSLNYLEEEEQPEIVVFYDDNGKEFLNLLKYPYLKEVYLEDYDNRSYATYFKSMLLNKNLYFKNLLKEHEISGIFPVYNFAGKIAARANKKMVAWYPDLQHKFYPQYFSKVNSIAREYRIKQMLRDADDLVLSSEDVFNHFKQFYTLPDRLRIHVMPFVSIIDYIPLPEPAEVLKKYNINKPYFIVSNQFYEHKNHIVVFEAVKRLQEQGIEVQVICTGILSDYKNPTYTERLKAIVNAAELKTHISILGFIPREDQLALMKASLAIIQPSKFEGWSTVVEDGKSLQTQVIASDIAVHQEQLGEKGFYFSQDSEEELAQLLSDFAGGRLTPKATFNNYTERIKIYATKFTSIFDSGDSQIPSSKVSFQNEN